jgi:ferredoxin
VSTKTKKTGAAAKVADALFLSEENLAAVVADVVGGGTRVVAPSRDDKGKAAYRYVTGADEIFFGDPLTTMSIKGFFLPQSETLFRWHQKGSAVTMQEVPTEFPAQVILGARPCDTAALEIVDQVMDWGVKDELWFGRRDATTVFNLACPVEDESCFCHMTGLNPDATKAADGMLTPVPGGYMVETFTPKGEAFVSAHQARFTSGGDAVAAEKYRAAARAKVAANMSVDMSKVTEWVGDHFEDEFWSTLGPRCNGCGACTVVCPTCHCFDIVDEPEGVGSGARRRNWDTCQTGVFTLHASGHNPRTDQNSRFRQRVNHKFYVYPSRFGTLLCSGCGRCSRVCPNSQDLSEILTQIDEMARS